MRIAQRFAAFRGFCYTNTRMHSVCRQSLPFKQSLPCTAALPRIFPAEAAIARRFRSLPEAHFAREAPSNLR
jgi:hypothetical protein